MEKKKKSAIWRHFKDGPKKGEVTCQICGDVLKYHASTTSLLRHCKAKHPDDFRLCFVNPPKTNQSSQSNNTRSNYMKPVELECEVEDAAQNLVTSAETEIQKKEQLNQFMVTAAVDLKPNSPLNSEDENTQDPPRTSTRAKTTTTTTTRDYSKLKQTKSPVWKFFQSKPGRREATCILCRNILRHHGNTTTLTRHLKSKHIAEALSIHIIGNSRIPSSSNITVPSLLLPPPLKFGTSDGVFNNKFPQPPPREMRYNLLDQRVLTMIIMDLQPVSFMDSKYFTNLMTLAVADARYNLPSKTTITSELLPKLYKETVDRVLNRLEDIQHIAITTELWSPRHQESFLCVTAHFICPEKWILQSLMLSTTTFYGTPTGKHIACELERTIAEWNITDKVRVMVTDNETNSRLSNEPLPWAYVPCLAHLINVVVNDAISADAETTALIDKVSDIVRYFKGDDDSKEKLAEVQRSLNLPEQPLILDCVPSRWNGVYLMLETTLEHYDAINIALAACEKEEMSLSSQDRETTEMVIAALKPFEIATKTMSSEKSTTISTLLPLVKGLMKMMSASCTVAGRKEPLVTALREGLAESFNKIEDIDWIVAASVLDPRFKKCPYIEKRVITKATEIIKAEVSSLCQQDASTENGSTSKAEEDSLWMFLDVMMNSDHQEELPSAASVELCRYLDSPPVSRDDNPLVFWKHHQELFPTLCQVATKYMTVPITSMPCERFFTEAGDALVEKRSKLRAENVNMMLFLNHNLPKFGQA